MRVLILFACLIMPFACHAKAKKQKEVEYCCNHEFYMKHYEKKFKRLLDVQKMEEIPLMHVQMGKEEQIFLSGCLHGLRCAAERVQGELK